MRESHADANILERHSVTLSLQAGGFENNNMPPKRKATIDHTHKYPKLRLAGAEFNEVSESKKNLALVPRSQPEKLFCS